MVEATNTYLWKDPSVPKRGWVCTNVEDLGEAGPDYTPSTCEMCNNYPIRFVHTMSHANHANLNVGCVCAEHMAQGYSARAVERGLKSKAGVRARWLTRKWRESKKGNPFLNVRGFNLSVHLGKFGKWGWRFSGPDVENRFSKTWYPTQDAAKLALFDAVWPYLVGD